ncbi:putative thiamine biosynthesis protein [Hartmannibacter diazotrophicus]|uniref:Thiamine pyrimidine synthase n=1 Tax=Hartmannibacter diazotrophicus TaxID=1482074 RepID=A0A2C9D904_9HYPH|nr:ABC transporter substrate-binding protein [Hartmannibacter diazotrophicus]SON56802.1 putative thiamine biosynthesis protein [Hartmannibacter diazotrophicus]
MRSIKSRLAAAAVATIASVATLLPAHAGEAVSVRLKWLPQAQFAGIYVAKAKGFYEEAGMDMTINPGGPNLNAETLVGSGNDTFGIASGTEGVLYAREKGLPIVCIGMDQQVTPFAFVTYDDSGINSVKDFKGKKVAVWFTGVQYTLYSVLAANGLSKEEVDIVSQPFSMQPFIDKQYDVATVTLYNELNTLKEQGINNIKLFIPDDSGITTQQDSIITSETMIKEKPEMVQAFLDATLKGWKYAFENKKEAVDIIMAAADGLDRTHQELMLDKVQELMTSNLGGTVGLGTLDMKSIEAVQERLLGFEALKAPVDLSKAFDTSFGEKVPDENKKL